jgi:hypothetical protein
MEKSKVSDTRDDQGLQIGKSTIMLQLSIIYYKARCYSLLLLQNIHAKIL